MTTNHPPPAGTLRVSAFIIMSYKEQCKCEGVILTRVKIIRTVLGGMTQQDAAHHWRCSKNTIGAVVRLYAMLPQEEQALLSSQGSLSRDEMKKRFNGLASRSRRPHGNKRTLTTEEEQVILSIHTGISFGAKRMHTHLKRAGHDMATFTLAKIKGCYKRNQLAAKKIRTVNKERRPLYDYAKLAAFEQLHMDTKHIADQHALPEEIYEKFCTAPDLPLYQWTIIDAKTRMRFLAYSRELSSFFGQRFLLFTILWLRAHGLMIRTNVLFDGGAEFCRASAKKLADWNTFFAPYGVTVEQTNGDKTRQNLIERSHRSDDEEFYVPRGYYMDTKTDFLVEAQAWQIYWNTERPHAGIDDLAPTEKLTQLGYSNAEVIGRFPTFILEDISRDLFEAPVLLKRYPHIRSQNVFDYYRLPIYLH